ncbi:GNAT family N-acetyltransferase [Cognatishimia sp. SS12]|uniref:GNAT family N-acetyltransferase n=1 Tax=Cognatishimia sp. SS12 TaxID=2979465 RepID=UPI0023309DA8|nr:GNAT family N-acyltransferase [Cognatishimia sp. SS12]MDC0737191.1 GNAT family N-acetyltransferase [Cognatishimia sp. SS12]
MPATPNTFRLKLADTDADLRAAQRLRYEVFVKELGGQGEMVDHAAQLERDAFDPYFDHLMLLDNARGETVEDQTVGVYRLLRDDQMPKIGRYYTESEYDVTPLKQSGRKLLELGRSCLHRDYRGGTAMYVLWNGLADYVKDHGIELLFGTASFHGTDIAALAPSLSLLHHRHLAPAELRVRAKADHFQTMDLMAEGDIDRRAAMREVPALIKGYLRLGGLVGEGAYIDHAFNTTDVCLIMDTARLNATQRSIYTRGA